MGRSQLIQIKDKGKWRFIISHGLLKAGGEGGISQLWGIWLQPSTPTASCKPYFKSMWSTIITKQIVLAILSLDDLFAEQFC